MKKIKLLSFSILLLTVIHSIQSCKKKDTVNDGPPKSFSEIKQETIKSKEAGMSSGQIQASGAAGVSWNAGDVFIYKTRTGLYGKFKVVSINIVDNYKLTIEAVTFNAAGGIHNQSANLAIQGTWFCDLEAVVETSGSSDFHWRRQNSTNTVLEPQNGAKFMKYVF